MSEKNGMNHLIGKTNNNAGKVNVVRKSRAFNANGMLISNARKIAKFYFSDFFWKCIEDEKNLRFVFYVHEKIQGEKIIEGSAPVLVPQYIVDIKARVAELESMADNVEDESIAAKMEIEYNDLQDKLLEYKEQVDSGIEKEIYELKKMRDIEYWKEFWGKAFHLVIIPYMEGEQIPR